MKVFVDTSALIALLDADQERHGDVLATWSAALDERRDLVTSNYVLVECFALVQRRLGLEALRALAGAFVPLMHTLWIDPDVHAASASALFTAGRRSLSLVDCTSFELMRRHGIAQALALDDDFAHQGFELSPR